MEGDTQQPGGYGPSMTAEQHRFRLEQMQLQDMSERLRRMEEVIYQLRDVVREGESQQRGRSASGRFTSGPGRAGSPNRGYDDGYDDGYYDGEQEGRRGSRQEGGSYGGRGGRSGGGGRQFSGYPPPDHVHDIDGYSGPSVPYYPPPNQQHWRGYGHRGMWGYGYPDPVAIGYLIGAMQYADPAAIN